VPVAEAFDQNISVRRTRRQPVSDRALIGRVEGTWHGLEELAADTEMMLGKENTVV
jgi:hypothetical protein